VRVLELWRYPVKSLLGERLDSVPVTADGFEGDRRFAIFDLETGFGLTARRVPQLLFASARLREDGGAEITLPDGRVANSDAELSEWIGRPVALRSCDSSITRLYENPADFEHDSDWEPFEGADGPFHDSARTRVSIVSTATIGDWDPRRFRSNVLLDGDGEDHLVGSAVQLGDARLDIGKQIDRCVMTTRPQAGGIERDLNVLRTIARERGNNLAVGALVAHPGDVRVGDELMAV
jgi:MOSC domain-containing protein